MGKFYGRNTLSQMIYMYYKFFLYVIQYNINVFYYNLRGTGALQYSFLAHLTWKRVILTPKLIYMSNIAAIQISMFLLNSKYEEYKLHFGGRMVL